MGVRNFVGRRIKSFSQFINRQTNHLIGQIIEWRRSKTTCEDKARNIPVAITSYNRLDCLSKQIRWLEEAGVARIVIVDNASTYPPLLEYLANSKHEVIRLKENLGPYAFWKSGIVGRFWNDYFVLTDPDVVPFEGCPRDLIEHSLRILLKYPRVRRVGIGLKIDDLPDCFSQKEKVIKWESRFWENEAEAGLYWADVDTTFALYRPRTFACDGKSLRTGAPYVARHIPWYDDTMHPSKEELHYRKCISHGSSWWTVGGFSKERDYYLGSSTKG